MPICVFLKRVKVGSAVPAGRGRTAAAVVSKTIMREKVARLISHAFINHLCIVTALFLAIIAALIFLYRLTKFLITKNPRFLQ